ncbi:MULTISPECIES: HU family DNA-binding protein [Euryhalocaulis]|uniref:HU family DNA-binding protein n=1 Tax=Euryhalocaulis TaxID=1712422 RepID=UPI00039F513D|nr:MULTISPECIES: HU family DNA-binding protein [Euryhalocaulis]MBA4802104.1 HU family DNA-binding protein [Euryhalocaulis sp.]
MNKSELVKAVADQADLTQADAGRAVDAFVDTVTGALKKREQVAIAGFGTFVAKDRKAREGRNPRTGETVKIPAKTSGAFKAGSTLKDL